MDFNSMLSLVRPLQEVPSPGEDPDREDPGREGPRWKPSQNFAKTKGQQKLLQSENSCCENNVW